MHDTDDSPELLPNIVERLDALGGIDLSFSGLDLRSTRRRTSAILNRDAARRSGFCRHRADQPEHTRASHFKFKAGGSEISSDDEKECRTATHILTLGPAAILGRVV